MFEEILPSLYRIKVPLPGSPLKATNSYVIKGAERSLVIDTGWNREDCMKALVSGLRECGVDLRQAELFITHAHVDHFGLAPALATDGVKIYSSQADAAEINAADAPGYWEREANFARIRGFPEEKLKKLFANHPARTYMSEGPISFSILKGGDMISIGDYLFKCIETPGHTEGHLCLYEPSKKILICGDHMLIDITPNILLLSDARNSLKEYLESLDEIYNLDVEIVLPGHGSIFKDQKKRVRELKQHHQIRLEEVISILGRGKQNVFQIASQMTWDIGYKSWDSFPPAQKWFAFGEAMAHLKYLDEEGKVGREMQGHGIVFFTEVSNA